MIKIILICMGDIKEKYLREAIGEYSKRISRFAELKIIELKEHIAPSNNQTDINKALEKDAEDIKKATGLVCDAIEAIITSGIDSAMNQFN